MPSTFFGLSISKSGLYTAMGGINTTAHNISNAETDGYCRQIVKQQASSALRVNTNYGMAGTGVDVTGVVQMRNEYYDVKYRTNSTMYGEYLTKEHYMDEIESYFNEVSVDGFTTIFNSFYDTLQEFSKKPADLAVRTQVTNFGQNLCEYFNTLYNNMKSVQEECNFEIKNQVDRINSLAKQIATLTKQINTLEVNGGTANDLRDTRNLLVDELSQICNVTVRENVVGNEEVGASTYVVSINSQILVSSYSYNELVVVPQKHLTNQTDEDGLYGLRWSNGQSFDCASKQLGGTLAALFAVRDGNNKEAFKGSADVMDGDTTLTVTGTTVNSLAKLNIAPQGVITVGNRAYNYTGFVVKQDTNGDYIYEFELDPATPILKTEDEAEVIIGRDVDYKGVPYYMAQLNEFIRTFSKAFNEVHTSGVDLNNEKGLDFFNARETVTGRDFVFGQSEEDEAEGIIARSFVDSESAVNYGSYYLMTAENFKVTTALIRDGKKVVAASDITNGVERADIAHKLIALKTDVSMFRQGAPGYFFQTLVAEIGIDTSKAEGFSRSQQNICSSIDNQRLSVSGVDTEEEAMNLIRYQTAYNLSAQAVTVMNQIYDKLINYMGA